MDRTKLICNCGNITYDKGYIALWLNDYSIPKTLDVEGVTLLKKNHFHVSLLCVKKILEKKSCIEQDILNHFCYFLKNNKLEFKGFTKEFRVASDAERKSVVALCKVSNLNAFTDYLSEKIGIEVPHQPAHVTLFTLQPEKGIGLDSKEEMEQKSKPTVVPEAVLAPLMGYKKIVVVDKDDKVLGTEYMMDAIKKGLLRRAVVVYVFNQSGQVLVQQRSPNVLMPLLLDQSAAGHVDISETYEQAAYRELEEELGLIKLPLKLIRTSFRTTRFFNAAYKLTVPDDTEFKFEPEELNAVFWYDITRLDTEMKDTPEKFSPDFREIWTLLRAELI